MRVAPRTRRMRRDDRGAASIFEVLAAVLILGIIMAIVFEGTVSLTNAIEGADNRTVNISEGRLLMQALTKDLRTATRLEAGTSPFVLADDREAIFYANLNPTDGPRRVRVFVNTDQTLTEQVTPPDADSVPPDYTYDDGPTSVRLVGRYIVNDASEPVFRYFDETGAELTATPLSVADSLAVRRVTITMSIRKSTNLSVQPTTLQNQVRLPNLYYAAVWGG